MSRKIEHLNPDSEKIDVANHRAWRDFLNQELLTLYSVSVSGIKSVRNSQNSYVHPLKLLGLPKDLPRLARNRD